MIEPNLGGGLGLNIKYGDKLYNKIIRLHLPFETFCQAFVFNNKSCCWTELN